MRFDPALDVATPASRRHYRLVHCEPMDGRLRPRVGADFSTAPAASPKKSPAGRRGRSQMVTCSQTDQTQHRHDGGSMPALRRCTTRSPHRRTIRYNDGPPAEKDPAAKRGRKLRSSRLWGHPLTAPSSRTISAKASRASRAGADFAHKTPCSLSPNREHGLDLNLPVQHEVGAAPFSITRCHAAGRLFVRIAPHRRMGVRSNRRTPVPPGHFRDTGARIIR